MALTIVIFHPFLDDNSPLPWFVGILSLIALLWMFLLLPQIPLPPEPRQVPTNVLEDARRVGNRVVQSTPNEIPNWKVILPNTAKETFSCIHSAKSTAIVYIHGYNISQEQAIAQGNGLFMLIREVRRPRERRVGDKPPIPLNVQYVGDHLCFYTFIWRGDLGQLAFGAAEKSADDSAASLVSFLKELKANTQQRSGPASMLLIAHSLGARVALEALHTVYTTITQGPWVDSLLMVQPAVPWSVLYNGSYAACIRTDFRSPCEWMEMTWTGRYHQSIRAARNVMVTGSSADCVLKDNFHGQYQATRTLPTMPNLFVALGFPYREEFNNPDYFQPDHPSYQEYDLSPPYIPGGCFWRRLFTWLSVEWEPYPPYELGTPVQVIDHSPIFDTENPRHQALVRFLWERVLAKYVEQ